MKPSECLEWAGKPIAFYPGLSRLLGLKASIFFTQLLFWKTEEVDWVWKTTARIEQETSLTMDEQRRVRKHLVDLGILEEKFVQETNRLYFKLHLDKLDALQVSTEKQRGGQSRPRGRENLPPGVGKTYPSAIRVREESMRRNKQSVAASAAPRLDGGLIGEKIGKTFDQICAEKLSKFLSEKRKLQRKVIIPNWTKSFEQLRLAGASKQRIKAALLFYFKNFADPFLPVIYSAKTFNEKFEALESAMKRKGIAPAASAEEAHKDLADVREELRSCNWSRVAENDLRAFLDQSLKAMESLCATRKAKMQAWAMLSPAPARSSPLGLSMFTDETLWDRIPNKPKRLAIGWARRINKIITTWKGWSGGIQSFTFRHDHPEFKKWILEVCHLSEKQSANLDNYLQQIA